MAKDLGRLLREKRESRYLSLPEAELATRIRADHLKAMEENHLEDLPGPMYAEIYLREYGRFLDLDPDNLLVRFRQSTRWSHFWQQFSHRLRRAWQAWHLLTLIVSALLVVLAAVLAIWAVTGRRAAPPPLEKRLHLFYPAEGAALPGDEVGLFGQVPPGASLTLNGNAIPVHTDGSFTATTPLLAGENHLSLFAADATGWQEQLDRVIRRQAPTPRPTLSLPAVRSSQQQYQAILHQVDAVHFPSIVAYFSVFDEGGNPWPNLTMENLQVEEDGKTVADFFLGTVPVTEPLAVALAIDISGSMTGEPLQQAQDALRTFLDNLGERDSACLISFNDQVSLLQGCTGDKRAVASAVDMLAASGDTALYDAILSALDQVAGQPSGRRAVVVLTDGKDTASTHTLDRAIERAALLNVPVYTLGLESSSFDAAPLEQLAQDTGAIYLLAPQASALRDLYAQLTRQFKGQYEVVYRSAGSGGTGKEHRLTLTARINGVSSQSSKRYQVP